jgi:hypothetical protein
MGLHSGSMLDQITNEFIGGGTTPLSDGKYTYELIVEFVGGSNQVRYKLIRD